MPTEKVPKDPAVKSLESNTFPGYVFIEVRIPTGFVSVVGEDGSPKEPERLPLFEYTANSKWHVLQEFDDEEEHVIRYYYEDIIDPGMTTEPVFEEISLINLVQAQGMNGIKHVNVIGYGIQSEGFSNPNDAWIAYKNQNGITDGSGAGDIPVAAVSAVTVGMPGNRSLIFTSEPVEVGGEFLGRPVAEVVSNVENLTATGDDTPLTSTPREIKNVMCTTPIAPVSTENWFRNLAVCEKIDISGIDSTNTENESAMFDNSPGLIEVRIGENTNVENTIPGFLGLNEPLLYTLNQKDSWQFWFEKDGEKWLGPNDIVAAANDIAANGKSSKYYTQYKNFMDSDTPMYIKWSQNKVHTASIIGINHDDRSDGSGKAGLTFMFISALDEKCRLSADQNYIGGWRDCELRYNMNPDNITYDAEPNENSSLDRGVWNSVPHQLKAAIKIVNKSTHNVRADSVGNIDTPATITTDAFWLPSVQELTAKNMPPLSYGPDSDATLSPVAYNEGSLYEWCKNNDIDGQNANAKLAKKFLTATGKSAWWLRSMGYIPRAVNDNAWQYAYSVYTDGSTASSTDSANHRNAVCPCFCL